MLSDKEIKQGIVFAPYIIKMETIIACDGNGRKIRYTNRFKIFNYNLEKIIYNLIKNIFN